jgi:hypothetical protein
MLGTVMKFISSIGTFTGTVTLATEDGSVTGRSVSVGATGGEP